MSKWDKYLVSDSAQETLPEEKVKETAPATSSKWDKYSIGTFQDESSENSFESQSIARVVGESIKRNFLPQSGKVDMNMLNPQAKLQGILEDVYGNLKEKLLSSKPVKSLIDKTPDKTMFEPNQTLNASLMNVSPGLGIAHKIMSSVSQRELTKQFIGAGVDAAAFSVAGGIADGAFTLGNLKTKIERQSGKFAKDLENSVVSEFRKAVNLKLPKNPTASDITKANTNIFDAMKNLFKNREQVMNFTNPDGTIENRLPRNLYEVSQSIQASKTLAYNNYSSLSKNSQATIKGDSIGDFLRNELQDPIYTSPNFDAARIHIKTLINGYKGKEFDLSTSERIVSELVKGTFSGLRGSGESRLIAEVDGKLGKFLVNKIDDTVSSIPKEYSEFRNDYKVLRKLENDVTRAANKAIPESERGHFGEYMQIFAVRDIAEGLGNVAIGNVGHGISKLLRGFVSEGVLKGVRSHNNPNKIISKAFSKFDEGISKETIKTGMEEMYETIKKFFNQKGEIKKNILSLSSPTIKNAVLPAGAFVGKKGVQELESNKYSS